MKNLLWISTAMLLALPAFAQEQRSPAARTTEYTFDGDTIEGDLTRPDVEYVNAAKRVEHAKLIRIREEFRAKVLQSAGEL